MPSDDESAPTRSFEEGAPTPTSEESPSTPPSEEGSESAALKLPESDVHFAFGPEDWYWMRCGSRWRIVRSKTASDWSELGIHTPYWAAFKHKNGTFIGGDNEDGNGRVIHSWNDSYMVNAGDVDSFVKARDAYIELHNWIGECVGSDPEKVKKVSLTIGPRGSYFARCESSQLTYALPEDTQTSIENSKSPPRHIALGIKGAWIVLFEDGSRDWNLRHAYPGLASTDTLTNEDNKVVFVALNPFREDGWLTVAEDGRCSFSTFFEDRQEATQLRQMTDTYMRSRSRRDGTTFSHSVLMNGSVFKDVRITPDSNAEESMREAFIARLRVRRELMGPKDLIFASAVAGGAGVLAKAMGLPTMKAALFAGGVGVGSAMSTFINGRMK